jgi:hypothetical protein
MEKMKWLGLLALMMILSSSVALAEDDGPELGVWKKEVELGVDMLQSSYSNNWNGGEKGTIVWAGRINAMLEKQFSPRTNWRNTMKLAYGQTHNQERNSNGDLYWKKPDKTDDIIELESMFRLTPESGWDPFVAVNFTSMFEDLTDAEGRALNFNPMTFKESAGMSRTFVNNDKKVFMTRMGIAFIQNSREFFLNASPDDATETASGSEIAAEIVTEYKSKGMFDDRLDWDSKLTLSLPVSYSGKSVFEEDFNPADFGLPEDIADYTTALDVDFENTFTTNITKVISVKFFVRWVYDKYDNTVEPVYENGDLVNAADVHGAIRKAGQFKQTLALGVGYKFN